MGDTENATVLVADDEKELVDLYEAFLAPWYDVRTAISGAEALEKVDDTVDVVLLDRRMPEMSGDEVLTKLCEEDFDCQVAMLTAVEPDGDIVEMPFDDYKTKPINRSELLSLVEVLLERASYDEQSQRYFSLASKKGALEAAANDHTEEYDELVDQLEEVREKIDMTLDKIGVEAAYKELLTGES